MLKLLIGAAIGAAAAWFLDPNDGTRRRNVARDKGAKYARQGKDQAVQKAGYARGAIKGKATAAAPGTGREPAEERLNDEEGTVYLRGEVDDAGKIESLREAASKVDGVRGVESTLHTPA
jgi:hypothetical protein